MSQSPRSKLRWESSCQNCHDNSKFSLKILTQGANVHSKGVKIDRNKQEKMYTSLQCSGYCFKLGQPRDITSAKPSLEVDFRNQDGVTSRDGNRTPLVSPVASSMHKKCYDRHVRISTVIFFLRTTFYDFPMIKNNLILASEKKRIFH